MGGHSRALGKLRQRVIRLFEDIFTAVTALSAPHVNKTKLALNYLAVVLL